MADKYDVEALERWLRLAKKEGPEVIRLRACNMPLEEQQQGEEGWSVYCVLVKGGEGNGY